MIRQLGLGAIFLVLLGLAACGGRDDSAEVPQVDGPALVMFYTEN